MSTTLKQFINNAMMTDRFDSNKYVTNLTMTSNTNKSNFQLSATYIYGAAFIEGAVGSDSVRIKVFINQLQGAQLWINTNQEYPLVMAFMPSRTGELYETIMRLASQ